MNYFDLILENYVQQDPDRPFSTNSDTAISARIAGLHEAVNEDDTYYMHAIWSIYKFRSADVAGVINNT